VISAWRRSKGLPENPLAAYRESGYQQKVDAERAAANEGAVSSYA
jgi:L-rhamnose isomerase/sugar isomerase